nr:NAD-dependent epimerase/dehydratase family protein [uncultured Psychroserpens sp.]
MKTSNSRRQFIKKGALASIAIPVLGSGVISCNTKDKKEDSSTQDTNKKLNILILGGTSFLGPHQIAYAISRGHKVATFTRGKTIPKINTEAFKNVEQLIGDRENNLKALENRSWDIVIDNSGRQVKWTKDTANLLKDNVGMYMYTSSTGVYYPYRTNDIKEDTKLVLEMPEGLTEDEQYEQEYGVMKGNSELAAIEAFGIERSIIIRPTYMIGPGDRTDRFVHWPNRLAKGGEVLVPGKKEDPVQYMDIRDVAEWMIRMAENKQHGTYNAVGPKNTQTMQQFVSEAAQSFDAQSNFVMVDDYEFLLANKVYYAVPWVIPVGDNYGSSRSSSQKAQDTGLTYRPLNDTVKDTYNWWNSDAVSAERKEKYANNPMEFANREQELLTLWKKHLDTKG